MIKSPFDVVKEITGGKRPWDDEIQSAWNTFMVNRVLSMNPNNIEFVNDLQIFFNIPPKNIYGIYCDIIPRSGFHAYIKKSGNTAKNIEFYKAHYGLNSDEAKDYSYVFGSENIGQSIHNGSDGDFTLTKLKKSASTNNKRKTGKVS
jgi:hypothetical protein